MDAILPAGGNGRETEDDVGVVIEECGPGDLDVYARVPSRYLVTAAEGSHMKNYDDSEEDSVHAWTRRFDTSAWGFLLASDDGVPVGGAAIALGTPGMTHFEDRPDQAVLLDLRVHPDHRRAGLGKRLFERAVDWAREHGSTRLAVETQDTNVAACRLYRQQGCRLADVDPRAYAHDPDPRIAHETRLIWILDL